MRWPFNREYQVKAKYSKYTTSSYESFQKLLVKSVVDVYFLKVAT